MLILTLFLSVKFDDNICDANNETIILDITGETDFSGVANVRLE